MKKNQKKIWCLTCFNSLAQPTDLFLLSREKTLGEFTAPARVCEAAEWFMKAGLHMHDGGKWSKLAWSLLLEQFSPRDFQLNQPKLSCPIGTESWKLSDLVQFCKYAKRGASEVKKVEFSYSTLWKNFESKSTSIDKLWTQIYVWCLKMTHFHQTQGKCWGG